MNGAWGVWLGLALITASASATDRVPEPVRRATDTGWIERVDHFPSRFVGGRAVEIWLPPDSLWDGRPLPVIYLHDGQNLFDASSSFIGVDWGVDSTLASLVDGGFCAPALLVGIANTERRRCEYTPLDLVKRLDHGGRRRYREEAGGPCISDDYLRFLVEELKPWVDRHYPTLPGPGTTGLMGSSRGGLISLAALIDYPGTFGAAACLSTHWTAGEGRETEWLRAELGPPGGRLLYFDHGDQTLDAPYPPLQRKVNRVLMELGWLPGRDFLYREFPGQDHSERAWRTRLDTPLLMLLPSLLPDTPSDVPTPR